MTELYEDPEALGKAIRKARRRAQMSQVTLGKKIGASGKRVGRMEGGDETTLGQSAGQRFASAAAVAAATGDFSLVGYEEPVDNEVIHDLKQEIGELRAEVHLLARLLARSSAAPGEELRRLQARLAAKNRPQPVKPAEGPGQ